MLTIKKNHFVKSKIEPERMPRVKEIDCALSYLSKMIDKFKHDEEKRKKLEIDYCFLQLKKVLND